MIALLLDRTPRVVRDHPEPTRAPGEAIVRTRLAGVCDTDLELARGYMSYRGVLGHEVVGEVLEADDPAWIGRRVVADINAGCGRCADCTERDGHHCGARTVLGIVGRHGVLAERFAIPERNLVAVPESVPDEHAVFAEPLAAAAHVVDAVPEERGPVVILGDGKLGLLIAAAVHAAGVRVVVVGHHREKLTIAATFGCETRLEADGTSDLRGAALVVEATGSSSGIALALELTRPRGRVVLKTTIAGKTAVDWSPIVINELEVVGSRCGSMRVAIDLLAERAIDPSPLICARYPLDRADAALDHASRPGTLKVLVENRSW